MVTDSGMVRGEPHVRPEVARKPDESFSQFYSARREQGRLRGGGVMVDADKYGKVLAQSFLPTSLVEVLELLALGQSSPSRVVRSKVFKCQWCL